MTKPTLGIGVLSWRAHKTLIQSLDSYAANGFLDLFDEKVIYFSDMTDEDIAIAKRYGWSYAGGPNAGIAGGMKHLAENMKSDYIILLQNDNTIIESKALAEKMIVGGLDLLVSGRADIVRLRHRWIMGEPSADVNKYLDFYPAKNVSDQFRLEEHNETPDRFADNWKKKLKRWTRPIKARRLRGRSIYIEDKPEELYPSVIQRVGDFLIADSSVLNFSDQCLFLAREFWLGVLMLYVDAHPSRTRRPNGFQAPEICINGPWWRNSHYKTALCHGLFSNQRVDGSYRSDHIGFEEIEK